ncbi:rhamnan synthesis F family protein [Aminobacter sp. UC22_36]|uniref:rhamnan synthesis F family protein n=1 Tax=Aminobacter sp. UC22_36 TaxID=3374549 RepID=UPI0037582DFE
MPRFRPLRSLQKRIAKLRYHDVEVFRARFSRRFGKQQPVQFHQGERHHAGGIYAIFLIWQPTETPWYVDNALASLDEISANVILVVNHELDAGRLLDLKKRCSRIIIRDNAGFDFGGYRDATLHLLENENPTRLLYLNDSVYFFKKGLTPLFQQLAGADADVAGSFENWQHVYHIQSFCFSVSQRIFKSPAFAKFWHDYLPANSRLWAIGKGEIGFSEAILPIAQSVTSIYSADRIRQYLAESASNDIAQANTYICRELRLPPSVFNDESRSGLVSNICAQIARRSQIHTAGFLYKKYFDCPLMKRDLLYRLVFDIDEIEHNLVDVGHEGHLVDILSDMKRKVPGDQLGSTKRRLFEQGII